MKSDNQKGTRKIPVIILITIIVISLTMCGRVQISKSEKPPGIIEGKLAVCPDKPNCVSSFADSNNSHYVAPLKFRGTKLESLELLKKALGKMDGRVIKIKENYIAVIFKTRIFRFVDDLEILIDDKSKIFHIRSASRVGFSDLGVNRKRVQTLRKIYNSAE